VTVGRLEGRNHERVVCERTGVAGDCGCSVDVWVGFLLRIVKFVFVLFFCDSTTAMNSAIDGYARAPHLADLSNTLHLVRDGDAMHGLNGCPLTLTQLISLRDIRGRKPKP